MYFLFNFMPQSWKKRNTYEYVKYFWYILPDFFPSYLCFFLLWNWYRFQLNHYWLTLRTISSLELRTYVFNSNRRSTVVNPPQSVCTISSIFLPTITASNSAFRTQFCSGVMLGSFKDLCAFTLILGFL